MRRKEANQRKCSWAIQCSSIFQAEMSLPCLLHYLCALEEETIVIGGFKFGIIKSRLNVICIENNNWFKEIPIKDFSNLHYLWWNFWACIILVAFMNMLLPFTQRNSFFSEETSIPPFVYYKLQCILKQRAIYVEIFIS